MAIIENKNRIGNITSSQIFKIVPTGAKDGFSAIGETYINQLRYARRLKRSTTISVSSRTLNWGNFLEYRVFDLLEFGWIHQSQETTIHQHIPFWSGSCDLLMPGKKIGEIKSYEPLNFAMYADALNSKSTFVFKRDFPQEYWQLVSNAIINKVPKAEAILYMPYKSELDIVRQMAYNYDGDDQWKYKFIVDSEDSALPYLPDDSEYKNLVRFEFEVPKEDIEELTARALLAGRLLKKP